MSQNSDCSEKSFDSSLLDQYSINSEQTTKSDAEPIIQNIRFHSSANNNDLDFIPGIKSPNKRQISQLWKFGQEDKFELGFKNGLGSRNIQINNSKLKKVKGFFDDSQQIEVNSMTEPFSIQPMRNNEQDSIQQFSMPFFKTVGKGLQVKVSSISKNNAQKMFQDNSYQKQTKPKATKKPFQAEVFVKTVNVDRKAGKEDDRRTTNNFNWKIYEEQKHFLNKSNSEKIQPQSSKLKTRSKRKNERKDESGCKVRCQFINFKDLRISKQKQIEKSSELQAIKRVEKFTDNHSLKKCQTIHCILCKIDFQNQYILPKDMYELLTKRLANRKIDFDEFIKIFEEVQFKLRKYELYWPKIVNKLYNASNLIYQINKKMNISELHDDGSFLKFCLRKENIGRKINLIVSCIELSSSSKIQGIFLKLSDGWYSIWSFIQNHNALYKYVKNKNKVYVGTKIVICQWMLHPINNILNYCEKSREGENCIQFFYNGSILLNQNAKLGYTHQQFYRPLEKCRITGGIIPAVEGWVVRIFSPKQTHKGDKKKYQVVKLLTHFLEIMTRQGYTCLMRFMLPQDGSLVEYFRLYKSYVFYRLRIGQDKLLSFVMNKSTYQESPREGGNKSKTDYDEPIQRLITNRFICNSQAIKLMKNGKFYDFEIHKGKLCLEQLINIQVQLEGEQQRDQHILCQQYELINYCSQVITIKKHISSNTLRRIPKIYIKVKSKE